MTTEPEDDPCAGAADPLSVLIDTLSTSDLAQDRALLLLDEAGAELFSNPEGAALWQRWTRGGGTLPAELAAALSDIAPYQRRRLPTIGAMLTCLPLGPGGRRVCLCRAEHPSPETEARRLIRRLAVHDLRTPLQALLAMTEGSAQLSEAARLVLGRIDDVLALSEAEATGDLSRDFDPSATVAAIVTMIAPLARERGAQLVFEPPAPRAVLRGPETIFRLLAQNLIGNAVTHGAGLRRVVLRLALTRPGVWSVTLEQWQQAGSVPPGLVEALARGGRSGSAGTRLMNAAGLVLDAHWNLLSRPGEEAISVAFSLPEATGLSPADLADAPGAAPPAADLHGARLLIVEDNAIVRDWMARAFRRAGAEVSTAPDGQAGLMLASAARPAFDAVLLDLVLPELDGLTLARRLKQTQRHDRPRLIGFSAHDDAETRAACAAAGMRRLLPKPLPAARLLASVAQEIRDLRPTENPMPRPAPAQMFNAEIAGELRADLGEDGARRFMIRALDEAGATVQALRRDGFGAATRAELHSSVGSSGITGLARVEAALRRVQDIGHAGGDIAPACDALAEAIAATRNAIDASAFSSTRSGNADP